MSPTWLIKSARLAKLRPGWPNKIAYCRWLDHRPSGLARRDQVEPPTCGQLGLSNEVFWHGPGSTVSIGDSAPTTRLKISNGRNCSPS